MRVQLTAPHVIGGQLRHPPEQLELPPGVPPTPLMIALDAEAATAIAAENIRVFGRWVGTYPHFTLLDDPPIIRPLTENRPVPPAPAAGAPR